MMQWLYAHADDDDDEELKMEDHDTSGTVFNTVNVAMSADVMQSSIRSQDCVSYCRPGKAMK